MAKANEFDKGLRAKTRPSNLDVRGQQRELFPFDAFEYQSPDESDSPFVRLKQPWVFGIDQSGIVGNSIDGERRLLLEAGEITFQKWNAATESWEDSSWIGSTIGGILADFVHMRGVVHPDKDLSEVDIGFRPSTDADVYDMNGDVENKAGDDDWTTKTALEHTTDTVKRGSHALKTSGGVGTLARTTYPNLQWSNDIALAMWFWRAAYSVPGTTEVPETTIVETVADDAGSLDGTSFTAERVRPDGSLESVGIEMVADIPAGVVDTDIVQEQTYNRAFSRDGSMLAVCTRVAGDGVRIYDTSDWSVVHQFTTGGRSWGASWSPNDAYLALHCENSPYLYVLDTSDWSVVSGTPTEAAAGEGPAYSPDGSLLASPIQGASGPLIVYNTSDWSTAFSVSSYQPTEVAFSPDGAWLAVTDDVSPYLHVYDTSDWSEETLTATPGSSGYYLSFSPDSAYLAVAALNAETYVVNAGTWDLVASAGTFASQSFGIRFSRNGDFLAVGLRNSPWLNFYSTVDWSLIKSVTPSTADDVTGIAMSPVEDLMVIFQTYSTAIEAYRPAASITGYDTIVPAIYQPDSDAATVATALEAALAHPSWGLNIASADPQSWEDVETEFAAYNAFDDGWVPTELDPSHDYALSQTVQVTRGGDTYSVAKVRFTHVASGTCSGSLKQLDYRISYLNESDVAVLTWSGSASVICVDNNWEAGPWDTTVLDFDGGLWITNTYNGNVTDTADVDTGFTVTKVQDGLVHDRSEKDFITLHDSADTWTKEGDNGGRYVDVKGVAGMTDTRVACLADVGSSMSLTMREWDQATDTWSRIGDALTIADASRMALCRMADARIALFDGLTGELKTYDLGTAWTQIGNTLTISGIDGGSYYRVAALSNTRIVLGESATGTLRTLDFDGTDWALVGEVYTVASGLETGGFDIAGLNETTIVLAQGETDEMVNFKFDGTTWSMEGTAIAPEAIVNSPSIAVLSETEIVYGSLPTKRAKGFSWDGDQWNYTFQGAENTSADLGYIFATMGPHRVMGVMFDSSLGPLFETWVRSSTVEVKHLYPTGLGLYLNGRLVATEATVADDWNMLWLPHTADEGLVLWNNNSQSTDDNDLSGTQNLDLTVSLDGSWYNIHVDELVVSVGGEIGQTTILDYYLEDLPWSEEVDYAKDLLFAAAAGGVIHARSPVYDQSGKLIEGSDAPAPVANSKRVIAEYLFDADQELDYTSSIANSTTITVSELPASTVAVLIYYRTYRSSNVAGISLKRNASATTTFRLLSGSTASGTSRDYKLVWFPTDGNTFYVKTIYGTLAAFWIVGYKVAAS